MALGHGGARSLAHIGVLQVLQEEGVRVRRIAGTSGGAIVGAMFALTLDGAAVEERFLRLLESEPYERMGLARLSRSKDLETNFWDQISTRIKGTVAMRIAQSRMSRSARTPGISPGMKSIGSPKALPREGRPPERYCPGSVRLLPGKSLPQLPVHLARTFRDLGPSNSAKKIPCQVPSRGRPEWTMTCSLQPTREDLMWASLLPSRCL